MTDDLRTSLYATGGAVSPGTMLDEAVAHALADAAANAVNAQQQAMISRLAALNQACVLLLSQFGASAATGGANPSGAAAADAADLVDVASEGLVAVTSAPAEGGAGGALGELTSLSVALALLDAGDSLGSVATLSTLLQAIAIARFAETGSDQYAAAAALAETMIGNATSRYEELARFAADFAGRISGG
jgi:hypothetical protein